MGVPSLQKKESQICCEKTNSSFGDLNCSFCLERNFLMGVPSLQKNWQNSSSLPSLKYKILYRKIVLKNKQCFFGMKCM